VTYDDKEDEGESRRGRLTASIEGSDGAWGAASGTRGHVLAYAPPSPASPASFQDEEETSGGVSWNDAVRAPGMAMQQSQVSVDLAARQTAVHLARSVQQAMASSVLDSELLDDVLEPSGSVLDDRNSQVHVAHGNHSANSPPIGPHPTLASPEGRLRSVDWTDGHREEEEDEGQELEGRGGDEEDRGRRRRDGDSGRKSNVWGGDPATTTPNLDRRERTGKLWPFRPLPPLTLPHKGVDTSRDDDAGTQERVAIGHLGENEEANDGGEDEA
jgi:hypothetical protein